MDHDVKSTALKKIQDILWYDGYISGETGLFIRPGKQPQTVPKF